MDCEWSIKNREFRNFFEHFDEKLEEGSEHYDSWMPFDQLITSGGIQVADPDQNELRRFDRDNFIVHIAGEEFDLKKVMGEIQELEKRLSKAMLTYVQLSSLSLG